MSKIAAILLPGLDGTGKLFPEFIKAAPSKYEPIAISYPPKEKLSYEKLADLVKHQLPCEKEYIIIAESFSGPVAVIIAAAESKGLLAVVLCNSFIAGPLSRCWHFFPWGICLKLPFPGFIIKRVIGYKAGAGFSPKNIRSILQECPADVLGFRMQAVINVDVRNLLSRVKVPVLDIRGRQDRLIGKKAKNTILKANQKTICHSIEGGHFLLQFAPKKAWQVIDSFVTDHCHS